VFINKGGWSSHQVVKPINSASINSWIGKIKDLKSIEDIRFIEPMLNIFNYSFEINNNSFIQRDELVVENEKNLKENKEYWIEKSRNFSEPEINRLNKIN
jgi:hypothetical protein